MSVWGNGIHRSRKKVPQAAIVNSEARSIPATGILRMFGRAIAQRRTACQNVSCRVKGSDAIAALKRDEHTFADRRKLSKSK